MLFVISCSVATCKVYQTKNIEQKMPTIPHRNPSRNSCLSLWTGSSLFLLLPSHTYTFWLKLANNCSPFNISVFYKHCRRDTGIETKYGLAGQHSFQPCLLLILFKSSISILNLFFKTCLFILP